MWFLLRFIIWFHYNAKVVIFPRFILKKIQVAFKTRQFFSLLICMGVQILICTKETSSQRTQHIYSSSEQA